MTTQRLLIATFALLLASHSAHAQLQERRATLLQDAPILLTPASTVPLHTAARGSSLIFEKTEGDWTYVQFQDPQLGLRHGVVQTRFLSIEPAATAKPMDLSVPKVTQTPVQPQPASMKPSAPRRDVPNRAFIDFNGMSAMEIREATSFIDLTPRFTSTTTTTATYPEVDTIWGWDLSAAVGSGHIGGGFRWLKETYTAPAAVSIRVPHPFLTTFATDSDVVLNGLDGSQNMFDFHATYSVNEPRWRFVAFGGPSYFRMKHTMVSRVNFSQILSPSTVNITTATLGETEGSAWGFNLGADGSWFFSRYVGVGAGLRFNRGDVNIIDPLSGDEVEWRVGVTTFVFGPRFRF